VFGAYLGVVVELYGSHLRVCLTGIHGRQDIKLKKKKEKKGGGAVFSQEHFRSDIYN
jgi:hypothetical protein